MISLQAARGSGLGLFFSPTDNPSALSTLQQALSSYMSMDEQEAREMQASCKALEAEKPSYTAQG